jgi:hypothetical protein
MALQRIDDRDSSIAYSSGWGLGGAPNEYDSSNTYATLQGQTATVKFRGVAGQIVQKTNLILLRQVSALLYMGPFSAVHPEYLLRNRFIPSMGPRQRSM